AAYQVIRFISVQLHHRQRNLFDRLQDFIQFRVYEDTDFVCGFREPRSQASSSVHRYPPLARCKNESGRIRFQRSLDVLLLLQPTNFHFCHLPTSSEETAAIQAPASAELISASPTKIPAAPLPNAKRASVSVKIPLSLI